MKIKNNYHLFALEGINFCGKTTISSALINLGYTRLPELSEKFRYGLDFPSWAQNESEARQNDIWFYEQECLRMTQIENTIEKEIVIADRSYLSSLAVTYARREVFKIDTFNFKKALIQEGLLNGKLITPYFIYLKLNIQNYLDRKKDKMSDRLRIKGKQALLNTTAPFKETEYINSQINFYNNYFKQCKDEHLILNAFDNIEINISRIDNWIKKVLCK